LLIIQNPCSRQNETTRSMIKNSLLSSVLLTFSDIT
jgi:hypothetical protein